MINRFKARAWFQATETTPSLMLKTKNNFETYDFPPLGFSSFLCLSTGMSLKIILLLMTCLISLCYI